MRVEFSSVIEPGPGLSLSVTKDGCVPVVEQFLTDIILFFFFFVCSELLFD